MYFYFLLKYHQEKYCFCFCDVSLIMSKRCGLLICVTIFFYQNRVEEALISGLSKILEFTFKQMNKIIFRNFNSIHQLYMRSLHCDSIINYLRMLVENIKQKYNKLYCMSKWLVATCYWFYVHQTTFLSSKTVCRYPKKG